MSSMFCIHEWEKESKYYAPPIAGKTYGYASEALHLRLALGMTTIIYRCVKCKEIKQVECYGKEVTE